MGVTASTSEGQEAEKPRRRPSLPKLSLSSGTTASRVSASDADNNIAIHDGDSSSNTTTTSTNGAGHEHGTKETSISNDNSPTAQPSDGTRNHQRKRHVRLSLFSTRSRNASTDVDTADPSSVAGGADAGWEWDSFDLSIPFEAVSGAHLLADGTSCRCFQGKLGGKEVVLKTLKPGASVYDCDDLDNELNIMQLLQNKHVVHLLGAGQMPEGGMFIAMERLSRGTLSACLGTNCPEGTTWIWKARVRSWFPRDEALRQAAGVAGALSYMHNDALPGAKIVHRDIKGCNLAFAADGTLKLFDFGLAKILRPRDSAGDNVYKMTGNTGSLRYMPPEVAKSLPGNETADVYSFALVIWEMIVLEKPFMYYNIQSLWNEVINGTTRPRLPSDWPESLRDLLTSCWSAVIGERPGMKEVEERLGKLAQPAVSH